MSVPLIVTRPDPGGTATVERAKALGLDARHLPLFAARPVEWTVPTEEFDALLLTSAQSVRMAGPGLDALAGLPVYAVGAATAAAAEAEGLNVAMTGPGDVQALIDIMASQNIEHVLWLCGRDRSAFDVRGMTLAALPVYAVDPVDPPRGWAKAIATPAVLLAHSARGAARITDLVGSARGHLSIVAISPAAADGAGGGWAKIAVAEHPDDAAMLAAAYILCQKER